MIKPNPDIINVCITVISYIEGCGYNMRTEYDIKGTGYHVDRWQSNTPINQANIEKLLIEKLTDYPECKVVLPDGFVSNDDNLNNMLASR